MIRAAGTGKRTEINLAIGGTQGGDPSEAEFPARYEIEYVRVFQKRAGCRNADFTAGNPAR
jgi:phosphoenolpyruvate synthase/pyruvate phosphate dikinase